MKLKLLTISLLAVVIIVAMRGEQSETDRQFAETLLQSHDIQQVRLPEVSESSESFESPSAVNAPVFVAGSRAALFFERDGVQGRIRGVVVIQDGRVVDLRILQSREGHDGRALDSLDFLASFRDNLAKPPLVVDAVSGATISSQAVTDAVNARLKQWVAYTQQEE